MKKYLWCQGTTPRSTPGLCQWGSAKTVRLQMLLQVLQTSARTEDQLLVLKLVSQSAKCQQFIMWLTSLRNHTVPPSFSSEHTLHVLPHAFLYLQYTSKSGLYWMGHSRYLRWLCATLFSIIRENLLLAYCFSLLLIIINKCMLDQSHCYSIMCT